MEKALKEKGRDRKRPCLRKLISAVIKQWSFLSFLPQRYSWKCKALLGFWAFNTSWGSERGKRCFLPWAFASFMNTRHRTSRKLFHHSPSPLVTGKWKAHDRRREENTSSLPPHPAFLLFASNVVPNSVSNIANGFSWHKPVWNQPPRDIIAI